MIIDHIKVKRDKIFKQDECSQYVIQPGHKVILEFNETIQPYLT